MNETDHDSAPSDGQSSPTPAINLLRLIREYARMRQKSVLDVERYERVLWFHEVPKSRYCQTPLRGHDPVDRSEDEWLRIARLKEPRCPVPSDVIEPWIQDSYPYSNDPEQEPQIREWLDLPFDPDNGSSEEQQLVRVHLEDRPDVREEYDRYLVDGWIDWTTRQAFWRSHQVAYTRCFEMYQDLKRLGEQYEVVIGVGLLCWEPQPGYKIQRHMLTTKVGLEFSAETGEFRVIPNAEGNDVLLEDEMIPDTERNRISAVDFENELKPLLDQDLWETDILFSTLRSLVQGLHADGEFHSSVTPELYRAEVPNIVLAPALILRKRTNRGLVASLDTMVEQLMEAKSAPQNLELLVSAPDRHEVDTPSSDSASAEPRPAPLFPLPANAEQRRIIEVLDRSSGVLVQGPPGTGKSHSIVNLVSHLLSEGQRVLVTAQTPRALAVLQEKFPEDLRPLCISHLGADRASLRRLSDSVETILGRLNSWDGPAARNELAQIDKAIRSNAELRSELDSERLRKRLLETQENVTLPGNYTGTPGAIARSLNRDTEEYGWLADAVHSGSGPPVTSVELESLLSQVVGFDEVLTQELHCFWPELETVPELGALKEAFAGEQNARYKESQAGPRSLKLDSHAFSPDEVERMSHLCREIMRDLTMIRVHREAWTEQALDALQGGTDRYWGKLDSGTRDELEAMTSDWEAVSRTTFAAPAEVPKDQFRADVEDLASYVDSGGHVGIRGMLSSTYRRLRYIYRRARVDGRVPHDNALFLLRKWVEFEKRLNRLEQQWTRACGSLESSVFVERRSECVRRSDILGRIVTVSAQIDELKQILDGAAHVPIRGLHTEETFDAFAEAVRAALASLRTEEASTAIEALKEHISRASAGEVEHQSVSGLSKAIDNRDLEAYSEELDAIKQLDSARAKLRALGARLEELSEFIPKLVARMKDPATDQHALGLQLPEFERAWYWAGAHAWLDEIADARSIESIDAEIRDLIGELEQLRGTKCSILAWQHFRDDLTEEHQRHLRAWEQSVRRLGKGTGRHASKHREDARKNLEAVRGAVPAWVMPLHRVYETVAPAPEIFDLIIVDEASQCSLDALPLFYLGKKIIVVGDDEQISPAAVGVPQEEFNALVDRYLGDLKLKSAFNTDTSLFDIASIWFSAGEIRLREHFRCMPEIIEFSNQLCYSSNPLIALRQYDVDRLEPIKSVYVATGYRRGKSSSTINEPEAEAVVEAIVQCCESPIYDRKSMGVICLLGQAQANLIAQMLLDQIGPEEMEKRRLVCGDSYSFQGDQRDVMFLSLVAATVTESGEPMISRAVTTRQNVQRFNVAASRAKDQMWLFHSMRLEELRNPDDLRRQLLSYVLNVPNLNPDVDIDLTRLESAALRADRTQDRAPRPFRSWFEVDVYLRVVRKGYRARSNFNFAGFEIDIVVEGHRARLAVEVDGEAFHGPEQYQADHDRQLQLERAGWDFWRVRESEFYLDPDEALEELWERLEALGIYPVGHEPIQNQEPAHGGAEDETDGASPEPVEEAPPIVRKSDPEPSHDLEAPIQLDPYDPWPPERLPDPRTAILPTISKNLVSIIAHEGPVVAHLAYRRYASACGIKRVRKSLQERMDRALSAALTRREVTLITEQMGLPLDRSVLVASGAPQVRVRSLGDRSFADIPQSELVELMKRLRKEASARGSEELMRGICACYGITRLRSSTRETLERLIHDHDLEI